MRPARFRGIFDSGHSWRRSFSGSWPRAGAVAQDAVEELLLAQLVLTEQLFPQFILAEHVVTEHAEHFLAKLPSEQHVFALELAFADPVQNAVEDSLADPVPSAVPSHDAPDDSPDHDESPHESPHDSPHYDESANDAADYDESSDDTPNHDDPSNFTADHVDSPDDASLQHPYASQLDVAPGERDSPRRSDDHELHDFASDLAPEQLER